MGSRFLGNILLSMVTEGSWCLTHMLLIESVLVWQTVDTLYKLAGSPGVLGDFAALQGF